MHEMCLKPTSDVNTFPNKTYTFIHDQANHVLALCKHSFIGGLFSTGQYRKKRTCPLDTCMGYS